MLRRLLLKLTALVFCAGVWFALTSRPSPCVDFYDLLSVAPGASSSDVRKAWHRKSLVFHPDKQRGLSQWTRGWSYYKRLKMGCASMDEAFHRLSEAKEALSDEGLRRQHDQVLAQCRAGQRRHEEQARAEAHAKLNSILDGNRGGGVLVYLVSPEAAAALLAFSCDAAANWLAKLAASSYASSRSGGQSSSSSSSSSSLLDSLALFLSPAGVAGVALGAASSVARSAARLFNGAATYLAEGGVGSVWRLLAFLLFLGVAFLPYCAAAAAYVAALPGRYLRSVTGLAARSDRLKGDGMRRARERQESLLKESRAAEERRRSGIGRSADNNATAAREKNGEREPTTAAESQQRQQQQQQQQQQSAAASRAATAKAAEARRKKATSRFVL
jgi:curved DNA-binding protein CbpA